MSRRKAMLEECPNCGSIWGPGSEEWQFQECDCCGWPSPNCRDFMRDEDDFDYDEDDYPDGWPPDEPDYDLENKENTQK